MRILKFINTCQMLIYIPFSLFSNNINQKEKINDDLFKELDDLDKKKKYLKIIEICSEKLKSKTEYYNEIDLLIRIGDAYFYIGDNKKAIAVYKSLLNKYDDFNGKDEILYNLCRAIYKIMPTRPDIDLENCKKMINYGNYALSKINNSEYKNKILEMIIEAKCIIEEKEYIDIEFYFKYKKYNSALYCCNKLIEQCNDSKLLESYTHIKAKILTKSSLELLRFIKKNKNKISNEILKETYEKILKNYKELKEIYKKNKLSDYNTEIEDLVKDFENKMSMINNSY